MREAVAANQKVVAKLEHRLQNHDGGIQELVAAIRQLMVPPARDRRKIGFEMPAGSSKANGRAIQLARCS
jgi:hypothetical protein